MLQVQKAHELDVVELTEDLPEYGLSKGALGTVLEVFDQPEEAYMIEFVDPAGENPRIADWIRPAQIENLDRKAESLFKKGVELLNQRKNIEASEQLRKAIQLKPGLIRILHNSISELAKVKDWQKLMDGMRFIIDINPGYQLAWYNLAIAYMNYGVQKARENELLTALIFFLKAFRIDTPTKIAELVCENIAASHVALGMEANRKAQLETALTHMESAYTFMRNPQTRRNLGLAYSIMADKLLRDQRFDAAIGNYIAAEESGMLTSENLNNRAVAHVHRMEIDEAIEALEVALRIEPDNEVAKANLSLLKRNLPTIRSEVMRGLRTEQITLEFFPVSQTETVALNSIFQA
jgi:tetratricopeptide (TPR) repeat protein